MRLSRLAAAVLSSLGIAACIAGPSSEGEPALATGAAPIVYGTPDTAHSAVVALFLAPDAYSLGAICSGTIVQVRGATAYVLTAAHCCNDSTLMPQYVVAADDYAPYLDVMPTTVAPPVYAVTPGSVVPDPAYNDFDHDFCMLRFQGASSATPTIPVAQPGGAAIVTGAQVEFVGFGVTEQSQDNSLRRHVSAPLALASDRVLAAKQHGTSGGTCHGDSGGPALQPAGVAQYAQKVVGVNSWVTSASQDCLEGMDVDSRVSSATGPDGFITRYLADASTSPAPAGARDECAACLYGPGLTGACVASATSCGNDVTCSEIYLCTVLCRGQGDACLQVCDARVGTAAGQLAVSVASCACGACSSVCAGQCAGTTTTTTVPTSTTTTTTSTTSTTTTSTTSTTTVPTTTSTSTTSTTTVPTTTTSTKTTSTTTAPTTAPTTSTGGAPTVQDYRVIACSAAPGPRGGGPPSLMALALGLVALGRRRQRGAR